LIDAKYTCIIGLGVGLCVGDEEIGLEVVGTDDGDVETGAAVGVDEGLAEGAEVVEVGLEVGVDVGAAEGDIVEGWEVVDVGLDEVVGPDVGEEVGVVDVGLDVEVVGALDGAEVGWKVVVVGEFEVGVLVVIVGELEVGEFVITVGEFEVGVLVGLLVGVPVGVSVIWTITYDTLPATSVVFGWRTSSI
jgi:hypothetical protein